MLFLNFPNKINANLYLHHMFSGTYPIQLIVVCSPYSLVSLAPPALLHLPQHFPAGWNLGVIVFLPQPTINKGNNLLIKIKLKTVLDDHDMTIWRDMILK